MDTLDNKKLLSVAEEAARLAGAEIKRRKPEVLESFGKDIKIDVDRLAHSTILKKLEETGIPVLSEEDAEHDFNLGFKWVADPLDGSLNFLRGLPASAVSIALMKEGEPVLGAIYDFNREEMFSGIVGVGAWLNGKEMKVSEVRDKSQAVIMTGFPSHTDYSKEALEKYISLVRSFKKVRLIGSAALSLAYVAAGRADAYYEKDIKVWDVAAGLALVKAAGGGHSEIKLDKEGGCEIFASNGKILADSFSL